MTRRAAAGVVLALALGGVAATVEGQPTPTVRSLSIATLAPAGSTWMRAFDAWNREIRRRTNNGLQFRFYPNGVQGDESEVIRKIRAGRIDGAALTAVGLSLIHRPTLVFQVPGMFESYAQLDRARDALRPELDAAFGQAGFALMGWGDVGTDRVFSGRAVHAPADLAGTRPFLWRDDALAAPFYDELRVHGVPMQLPEVLTGLSTHQVDTLIASPLTVVSLQWAPHVSHMLDLPVAMEIGALVIGRAQFDALPEPQRQVLRETAAQYSPLMVRNVRHDDDGSVGPMRDRGLVVDTPSAADRAQWAAVFARTRARLMGAPGAAHAAGAVADAAFFQRVQEAAGR